MPPVLYSEYSSVWLVPSCVLVPPFAVCINSDSLSYCNLSTPHLAAATIGFNQTEYTFPEGDTVVDIVVRVLEGELGTLYTVALDLVPRTASGEQYEYLLPSHIAQQCIISYSALGNIFPYCPVILPSQF